MSERMEINNIVPKMDLKHFLVFVIPGMIFSFTILCPINKLPHYTLLPADLTTVNLPYVSLLIFYLLTSGLVFGIIFHFLYLWHFPRPSTKNEDDNKFRKYPAEFREILLKAVNIDISYKQVYRAFFGNLCISTFLSTLVLLFSFYLFTAKLALILLIILLFLIFIFSGYATIELTKDVNIADRKLIGQLDQFLDDAKENFQEEVYKNLFKKQ